MSQYPLTAQQILVIDEIAADKAAINRTLDVALQYHSNRTNEVHKTEKALWDELSNIHGFDLKVAHMVAHIDGRACIVPAEFKIVQAS